MNDQFFYCDTNILRYLVDNPSKWTAFRQHLFAIKAILVVSWIQVIELSKVPHYHEGISRLLLSTRSALLKWWKDLLREETEHYPQTTVIDPIQRPLISDYLRDQGGQFVLRALFSSYEVDLMWQTLDDDKEPYMKVMSWLSTTAPGPAADENVDFTLHNYGFVVHELRELNESFLNTFKGRANDLNVEAFRGSYMRAAYTYYRFVQKGFAPQPSDIGDIHQVFYVPYCKSVVLEKSMAGILYQLRREKNLAPETDIKSIRFVRDLPDG